MGESLGQIASGAIELRGTPIPRREQSFTGKLARLLWPHKTAAHLAARAGCSERAAKFYLAGDREWSGPAISAVMSEILERIRIPHGGG